MRQITARELLELPEGTLYSWFVPMVATGLFQKGATLRHADGSPYDFYEQSLLPSPDEDFAAMRLDDAESRWGRFEYDALALVYEPDDLVSLHVALRKAFEALPHFPAPAP